MALFIRLLQFLEVLTTLAAVNVFKFDKHRRKFEVRRLLRSLFVRLNCTLLLVVIALTAVMVISYTVFLSSYLFMVDLALVAGSSLGMLVLSFPSTKLLFIIYINFLLNFRLECILQVLNDFVVCYDLHTSLYGAQLCINWMVLTSWAAVSIAFDPFFWIAYSVFHNWVSLITVLLVLPCTLLSLTSIFAVAVLHAFYATIMLDNSEYCPTSLLRFYDHIQQLRCNLEALMSFKVLMDVLVGMASVSFSILEYYVSEENGILTCAIMLLPMSNTVFLTYCTDSMNTAERKIGDQPTHSKKYFKKEKLFQLWLLNRMCISRGTKSMIRVLHMEKAVVLAVASNGWVFAMFILHNFVSSLR